MVPGRLVDDSPVDASLAASPAVEKSQGVQAGHGAYVLSGSLDRHDEGLPFLIDAKGKSYDWSGRTRRTCSATTAAHPGRARQWVELFEQGVPLSRDAALCRPARRPGRDVLTGLAAALAAGLVAATGCRSCRPGRRTPRTTSAATTRPRTTRPTTTDAAERPRWTSCTSSGARPVRAGGKVPGSGVTVAVVDSGGRRHRPDDGGARRPPEFPTVFPSDYHGTVVAGLIAGHESDSGPIGIAPGATIST